MDPKSEIRSKKSFWSKNIVGKIRVLKRQKWVAPLEISVDRTFDKFKSWKVFEKCEKNFFPERRANPSLTRRDSGLNSTMKSNPREKCTITGIFQLYLIFCIFSPIHVLELRLRPKLSSEGQNICIEIVSQQIGREWIFARCTLLKTRRTPWILQQKRKSLQGQQKIIINIKIRQM